jgi:hypothetical protein
MSAPQSARIKRSLPTIGFGESLHQLAAQPEAVDTEP